jgi:NitT/TauT family transport system permease protein
MARRIPLSNLLPIAVGAATVVFVFGLLEILLRVGVVNQYILPFPSEVLLSFKRIFIEEDLLNRIRTTAFEMLVACVAVIVIGVPIGAVFYRFDALRQAMIDGVAALAAAPLVLAFPLFLVMFGRSSTTVIVMASITGLSPIIIKTTEGLLGVRPVLINVGKSLNLTDWKIFLMIALPAALPVIFTGIRIGWTFALIGVVGIEFLINLGGLGQMIGDLADRYDLPGTYAAICFVVLVSTAFFVILEQTEKWLRPST